MRKLLLLGAVFCMTLSASAQRVEDTGRVIDLLPEGVTVNVGSDRKGDKMKNIVVAGSPEKGYKAFFAATDATHGEELWVTDGTPEGTHIVKDIVEGAGSGNPCYLGRLNDKVLFSAYTEGEGQEPWVSDGTEEGTMPLADCYLFGDGDPKAFLQMNETQAVFIAIDDESAEYNPEKAQYWLWVTDGTPDGTKRIVEDAESEHQANCIWPGKDNKTLHTAYCRVGRRVYIKADNTAGMIGEEVWVTDGTEEGTYLVMDINWEPASNGGTCAAGIDHYTNYKNEKLFFEAWTPTYGLEPWTTDGTQGVANTQEREVSSDYKDSGDDHTYMIVDRNPGRDANGIGFGTGTFGQGWEVFADRVWFRGWGPEGGYEFAGTNMQKGDYVYYDLCQRQPSIDHNSYSDPGCIFDNSYIFCASSEHDKSDPTCWGGELWVFDGKNAPKMPYDFVPGDWSNWAKEQVVAGGSLYWFNETNGEWNQGFGNGLYRLDSKDEKPVVCNLVDPTASATGDMVHTLRNLGGTIIYCAGVTNKVYCYEYTKPNWDGKSDMGYLEPNFNTEAEENAIQEVNVEKDAKEGIYNLNGIKMNGELQKGVYVINGKKTVIR